MLQEINLLQDIVSNLGFPIVMVGYFIWDKTKVTNTLVKAIQDNTIVMNRLLSKLDSDELADVGSDSI